MGFRVEEKIKKEQQGFLHRVPTTLNPMGVTLHSPLSLTPSKP